MKNLMNILIFRTDIRSRKMVNSVKQVFENHPIIKNWSVDLQDIDNVLRIEVSDHKIENEMIKLIKKQGFICEVLQD